MTNPLGLPSVTNTEGRARLDGLRVLLVEDSWIIAQSYAGLLDPLGVEVLGPAAGLPEARKLLSENEVDVALVDMQLQGESASDLVVALGRRGVPVVVVTGYEVPAALDGNAVAVLKKPVRAEHLLRSLRAVVAARDHARGLGAVR
jgi:CheY-like chemotaxis protein